MGIAMSKGKDNRVILEWIWMIHNLGPEDLHSGPILPLGQINVSGPRYPNCKKDNIKRNTQNGYPYKMITWLDYESAL